MKIAGSRTYTIAILGVIAQALCLIALVVVAIAAPAQLDQVIEALKFLSGGSGVASGLGSLAMGLRDGLSGGATSSNPPGPAAKPSQAAIEAALEEVRAKLEAGGQG